MNNEIKIDMIINNHAVGINLPTQIILKRDKLKEMTSKKQTVFIKKCIHEAIDKLLNDVNLAKLTMEEKK